MFCSTAAAKPQATSLFYSSSTAAIAHVSSPPPPSTASRPAPASLSPPSSTTPALASVACPAPQGASLAWDMPTLPSTYSSSYHTDGLASACIVATPDDALSGGPTPDPDLDELVLVSVVTGDGVGAITHPASLAAHTPGLKPHISLANLSLHSPSSILGTPFDLSPPRFEYPFPPAGPAEPELTLPPSIFGPYLAAAGPSSMPSAPPYAPTPAHAHTRTYAPTHPKHFLRDPPMPPTLAKKRKSARGAAPDVGSATPRRRTRSASLAAVPELDRAVAGRASGADAEDVQAQRRFTSEQPEYREHPASHGMRI